MVAPVYPTTDDFSINSSMSRGDQTPDSVETVTEHIVTLDYTDPYQRDLLRAYFSSPYHPLLPMGLAPSGKQLYLALQRDVFDVSVSNEDHAMNVENACGLRSLSTANVPEEPELKVFFTLGRLVTYADDGDVDEDAHRSLIDLDYIVVINPVDTSLWLIQDLSRTIQIGKRKTVASPAYLPGKQDTPFSLAKIEDRDVLGSTEIGLDTEHAYLYGHGHLLAGKPSSPEDVQAAFSKGQPLEDGAVEAESEGEVSDEGEEVDGVDQEQENSEDEVNDDE